MAIPTSDPIRLRAGDTWQWRRDDLTDYPATAWTLTYYFRNAAGNFDVTAAADGTAYLVTVAKATTAGRSAGDYDVVAVVSSATERFEVAAFRCTVLPDYAAAAAIDGRSFARKMLSAVESALLNRASNDELDLIDAMLADLQIKRTPEGLMKLRSQLRGEVSREDAAAGRATGQDRGRLLVRFSGV